MKEIELTKGYKTIVDDEDYELITQWKWSYFKGYARRTGTLLNGKRKSILLHRLIINAKSGEQVDHKNRNKLDNRKENLRIATASQNAINRLNIINKSRKYRGIYFRNNSYKAAVSVNKKTYNIGSFNLEMEAAKAYDIAALYYHGEFVYLNFPELINEYKKDPYYVGRVFENSFRHKVSSKYFGVYWKKQTEKWIAQVTINNKTKSLGCYTNEMEAAKVRDLYIIHNAPNTKAKLNFSYDN